MNMTSTVTFTTLAPVRHSGSAMTTIPEESSALIAAAQRIMQSERAQCALSKARMNADAKTSEALHTVVGNIGRLIGLVANLAEEVAALKAERTKKNLVQTATLEGFRRQVAELATRVQTLENRIEFMKLSLRDYYIRIAKRHDAAVMRPGIRGVLRNQETWRMGRTRKSSGD